MHNTWIESVIVKPWKNRYWTVLYNMIICFWNVLAIVSTICEIDSPIKGEKGFIQYKSISVNNYTKIHCNKSEPVKYVHHMQPVIVRMQVVVPVISGYRKHNLHGLGRITIENASIINGMTQFLQQRWNYL